MTDVFERLAAALADRYTIERELGAGGMATVYLAHDLKHERKVALKVLRPELAAVLGAERFIQEIKTTANLQHSHILPLFDSGEADGFLYYVMPFIDGETLRDKLNREKQLGIEEAVKITTEVADALDYAHRQNVIHRDIKPENILLHDGRPVVADFGIALAVSAAAGGRMTETGLSLGTPHYMSPEQATAEKDLTHRSDIYSLGAVLYEMLTGDPPHVGSTAQQIIMKIVTDEARPVTQLRKSVPPNVAAAVAKALEKLPADRFGTAQSFGNALADTSFAFQKTAAGVSAVGTQPWWVGTWVSVASVAALMAIAAVTGWLLKPSPDILRRPIQFYIKSDSAHQVMTDIPAISPDGSVVVYRGRNDDRVMLFQRRLDELESRPIIGTEDGELPFFSPDGEWLGFWRNHTLLKTRLDGGMPLTIASGIGWGYDATWGPGDMIIFSSYPDTRPYQVSAGGGIAEPFLPLDTLGSGIWFSQPSFLPGGNAVLFNDWSGERLPLYVVDLETGELRTLGSGAGAKFVESGHLVYGQADGSLILQPFDKSRLETTGQPTRLEWDAGLLIGGWPMFDVSLNGTLVVSLRGPGRQLQSVDRAGREHPFLSGHETWVPRFSPDGAYVAYGDVADGESLSDVWVYHRTAGTQSRLTLDARNANDPAWSPDGRFLAISARDEQDLYVVSVEGGGEPTLLLAREGRQWPSDWSNDGRFLVFTDVSDETGYDIWTLELGADSVAGPFLVTDFNELAGVVSPDGRWLAYQSDESGMNEVYVQSFPEPGHKVRVSTDGGQHPVWSPDNRGLYYWSRGQLFEALVTARDGLEFGDRQLVLQNQRYLHESLHACYDVHPNGQEFVILSWAGEGSLVVASDMLVRER